MSAEKITVPGRRLGRLPRGAPDPRRLMFSRYAAALPPPPAAVDYTRGISAWGMLANDRLGCCTISAVGHAVQSWRVNLPQNPWLNISDGVIEGYYSAWAGYVPGDASTDRGAEEVAILKDWRARSFAGHNLYAFVEPSVSNLDEIRQSVWLFGGVYLGLDLPVAWENAAVWDVASGAGGQPGSWGGHAVWAPRYDRDGVYVVTWGGLTLLTWRAFSTYVEESHCLMSDTDWMRPGVPFDYAACARDLLLVAGEASGATTSP